MSSPSDNEDAARRGGSADNGDAARAGSAASDLSAAGSAGAPSDSVSFESAAVLARRERDKYRRLWQRPEYRLASPGESCAERALLLLGARPGESITDFGCGTGRACAIFRRHGLAARAIDHAENCLDPGVAVPLELACLWRLPPGPATDHGFCVDVLEHIPTSRIDDVLAGIAARARGAVFFRISTVPDACGRRLIGEALHLTVAPASWWAARLGRLFLLADCRGEEGAIEMVARVRAAAIGAPPRCTDKES